MKKWIGIFLCSTAFAFFSEEDLIPPYSGERVVFELPPGMESHEEYCLNKYYLINFERDEDCFGASSRSNQLESAQDLLQELLEDFEHLNPVVIESSANDTTLMTDDSCWRILETDTATHTVHCTREENVEAWLPYIQSAHVGTPAHSFNLFEGDYLQAPEGAERLVAESSSDSLDETWLYQNEALFIHAEKQDADCPLLSAHDFYIHFLGELESSNIDLDLLDITDTEAYAIMKKEDGDMLLYLLVEPNTLHMALATGDNLPLLRSLKVGA